MRNTAASPHASRSRCICNRARRAEQNRSAQLQRITRSERDGGTQAKILGMGLRGPGTDPRAAKTYGRADGEALRSSGADPYAAAERERVELARAAGSAARCARRISARPATHDRAGHSYGKGSRDLIRAFRRYYPNPIDVVAFPRDEKDIIRILEWCDSAKVAAAPYGGGSSVVGGVEAPSQGDYRGAVSIDLMHLNKVVEVDKASRAANIQGGALGPASGGAT